MYTFKLGMGWHCLGCGYHTMKVPPHCGSMRPAYDRWREVTVEAPGQVRVSSTSTTGHSDVLAIRRLYNSLTPIGRQKSRVIRFKLHLCCSILSILSLTPCVPTSTKPKHLASTTITSPPRHVQPQPEHHRQGLGTHLRL